MNFSVIICFVHILEKKKKGSLSNDPDVYMSFKRYRSAYQIVNRDYTYTYIKMEQS